MKKQRLCAPFCYPPRAAVGEPLDWADETYKPAEFEAGVLHQKVKPAWADIPHEYDIAQIGERMCYDKSNIKSTVLLECHFDSQTHRFKNPGGKTGIRGRGELGRWGPNHAADVIVTRTTEAGEHMALLCTKKVGDGKSALCWPAGMVEPGHTVPQTLKLELTQEALKDSPAVDRLFNECDKGLVYAGLVDDWRNTDDAWIETVAQHFHATEEIAKQLQLAVADTEEIEKVAWVSMANVSSMYASHFEWFTTVYERLKEHDLATGRGSGASPIGACKKRAADELSGDAQSAAFERALEPLGDEASPRTKKIKTTEDTTETATRESRESTTTVFTYDEQSMGRKSLGYSVGLSNIQVAESQSTQLEKDAADATDA